MNEPRRLQSLRWGLSSCPLSKPYDLSFATLTHYDSVWVVAEDEFGAIGIGEAVPLPGYNWETLETISATIADLVVDADRQSTREIIDRCRRVRQDHPFAASAVMTALDMPSFLSNAQRDARIALSAPISAEWPLEKMRDVVQGHLEAGYDYLKVKVGRNLDADTAAARCLLSDWPGRHFGLVFDANQAYSAEAALAFARALRAHDRGRLQWFEQPVDRRNWEDMERLCRASEVRVVLDECIYDEADLERAALICAYGIKLKLMKNFGIAETLKLARRARSLGLAVAFGNGVATDIGNLGEYLVLATEQTLFSLPGECNGFAKLRRPLVGYSLAIDAHGRMVCSASGHEIATRLRQFADEHAAGRRAPSPVPQ